MVVKFGVQQDRGAAGQSMTQGNGKSRNFANLYNLNKSDQSTRDAAAFTERANATNQDMSDAVNLVKRPHGNTGQAQNSMAAAVDRAKGISNDAQNYSMGNNLSKNGASAYQSGVGSFYGGGNTSAGTQQIRRFGGLYQSVLGQQSAAQQAAAKQGAIDASVVPGKAGPTMGRADTNQLQTDTHNLKDNGINRRGAQANQVNRLSSLDWMLKTGRISTEDYYKAQRDDAFFDVLSKKYN